MGSQRPRPLRPKFFISDRKIIYKLGSRSETQAGATAAYNKLKCLFVS